MLRHIGVGVLSVYGCFVKSVGVLCHIGWVLGQIGFWCFIIIGVLSNRWLCFVISVGFCVKSVLVFYHNRCFVKSVGVSCQIG